MSRFMVSSEKIKSQFWLEFGFVSDMFDMHEPIIADFWTTFIIVNNFQDKRCKIIFH